MEARHRRERPEPTGDPPHDAVALVVQGGALRGAYAVGALRVIYDELGPEAFHSLTTVSASVFACSYFVAHQVQEMEHTWRERVHGNQLVRFGNALGSGPVMELDYLVDLFRGPVRLDLGRVAGTPVDLRFVLTDYATGRPAYLRPGEGDAFDAMRASCAIPGLYPTPVTVGDGAFIDGARSDPLPIEYVLARGYRRVLVVMTGPRAERKKPASRWGSALAIRSAAARSAWLSVHERYNRALDLLASPPPGVRIDVISPERAPVHPLTRDRGAIVGAIELGKVDASRVLSEGRRNPTR